MVNGETKNSGEKMVIVDLRGVFKTLSKMEHFCENS